MTPSARGLARLAAALVCAVVGTTGAVPILGPVMVAPAHAHGDDPLVRVRLVDVAGSLPSDVTVQVHTTVSEQVVVSNPTRTPLRLLDPSGDPFVSVGAGGVRADVHNPFFFATLGPPDAPPVVPDSASEGAVPAWRLVSRDSSWGWFDPRLHPEVPGSTGSGASGAPGSGAPGPVGIEVLARWSVPMRYGAERVEARGDLVREPLLGTWAPGPVEAPAGVMVQLLPGLRPAVALTRTTARSVSVLDDEGTAILRIDRVGVAVDPVSEAALSTSGRSTSGRSASGGSASGRSTAAAYGSSGLVPVATGSFHAWLDGRVQPARVAPADPTRLTADGWSIPVVVDGRPETIRGEWHWQPASADPSGASLASAGTQQEGPARALPAGLVVAGLVGAAGLRVLHRRVRRRGVTGSHSDVHSPLAASGVRREPGA